MSKYKLGITAIPILLATSSTFTESFFSTEPSSQTATTNSLTPPVPAPQKQTGSNI
jgi:hypothetical protein